MKTGRPQAPVGRDDQYADQKSERDRGGVHADYNVVDENDDHDSGCRCSIAQGRLEQRLVHAADCS